MRICNLILCMFLFFAASGCAIMGKNISAGEAEIQYGKLPENYQAMVIASISPQLIDPLSAMYQFHQPQPKHGGWWGAVWVNSRNRFGGYAGRTLFEWMIAQGKLVYARQHVFAGLLR